MKNEKVHLKTIASGQVAYFDLGQGPILLFLHGFPDTPYSFQDQVNYFKAKGYRCLVPFMPGYGDTSLPSGGSSSMLAIANMLDDWLTELVKGESIVVYGHDWGSIVAQMLTAFSDERGQEPYKIEKLVIGAVPPMAAFLKNVSFRQLYRSRYMAYFQRPKVIAQIQNDGLDYIRELWERWSPDLDYPNAHCEETIALLKQGNALANGIGYYRHMFNPWYIFRGGSQPVRQMKLLLKKRSVPCLMVVGENDACIGIEVFDDGEKSYPHANTKRVGVPGAGHFVHFEKPEFFSEVLEEFLIDA